MGDNDWMSGGVLDLDGAAASKREARGKAPEFTTKGERFALPVELPIDVLEPLTDVSQDVALLLQDAVRATRGDATADDRERAGELILLTLVANPEMPRQVVDAAKRACGRLFCDEGPTVEVGEGDEAKTVERDVDSHGTDCQWSRFVRTRPTVDKARVLAPWIFREYGVSLGEVFAPPAAAESSGQTSKRTSRRGTKDSTPEGSGSGREKAASLERAGSSPS